MIQWKKYVLSDLGFLARGKSKHRPRDAKHLYGGVYPFIQTGDIRNSKGRIRQYTQTYSKAGLAQSKLWPENTICITIAANIAETGVLKFPACFPDSVIGFIADSEKVNTNFIEFFLRYKKRDLQTLAYGTAQDNINLNTFENLELIIPKEKTIQDNIASILTSIEDKIFILQDINDKFNELAQLIFSNYFLLITTKYKDGSFGNIISELTNKVSTSEQNNYKVLSAVNTGQLIPSEDYFSKQVFSKDLSKYKTLEQFDFAYNPARVNIGSIGMLDKPIKGCVSPVYIAFRTKPNWHYFVDLMIKQPHIRKTIEVYCSGSVRQVLRFEDFCRIEIKLPPEKKVLEFNEVYQSILNKINHNKQQIEKLTALRDTILPKLMTGKIEIKN